MKLTTLRKIGIALLSAAVVFLATELICSELYRRGIIDPPSGAFFENPGETFEFDPVSGFRAPRMPARGVRIDGGVIEYEAKLRGNNQGFYDADDFFPARPDGTTYRVAVLGDSFTAAPYLAVNWPDRVESLSRESEHDHRLQLLNFSLDAIGLANWRNIVVRKLAAENYQVDLVLFAVFGNDLRRSFRIMDLRGQKHYVIGDAGWDPSAWPEAANEFTGTLMEVDGAYVVSPAEFDSVIQGRWHPELPRPSGWYLSNRLAAEWRDWSVRLRAMLAGRAMQDDGPPTAHDGPPSQAEVPGPLRPQQRRLVDDIHQVLAERGIPAAVVRVPAREEAIDQGPVPRDMVEFAEILGATLIDGADAFDGLTVDQRRADYFVHDGHWNQDGSDRFARSIFPVLERLAAMGAPSAAGGGDSSRSSTPPPRTVAKAGAIVSPTSDGARSPSGR